MDLVTTTVRFRKALRVMVDLCVSEIGVSWKNRQAQLNPTYRRQATGDEAQTTPLERRWFVVRFLDGVTLSRGRIS